MVTAPSAQSLVLLADVVRQVRDRYKCPVERASDIIQTAAINERPALFLKHADGRVQVVDALEFSVWMGQLKPYWSFDSQETAARFSGDPLGPRLPQRNPAIAADTYLTWSKNDRNPGKWLAVSPEVARALMHAAGRELVVQEPSGRPKWSGDDLQILVDAYSDECKFGQRGAHGRVVKRFGTLFPHRPAITSVTGLKDALKMAERAEIVATACADAAWIPVGLAGSNTSSASNSGTRKSKSAALSAK